MKLSIKKGHIVLGALVLALGAAVYLNWDYMKQTDYVAAGNTNQTTNDSANCCATTCTAKTHLGSVIH